MTYIFHVKLLNFYIRSLYSFGIFNSQSDIISSCPLASLPTHSCFTFRHLAIAFHHSSSTFTNLSLYLQLSNMIV